jgi:hypothetical protein
MHFRTTLILLAIGLVAVTSAQAGVTTVNGWYKGEEIYYIDRGSEEGIPEEAVDQIYAIGGNRKHQANVVQHIPGQPGYSPHWNVNVVKTANGVTVQDIIDAGYISEHFDEEGVVFDDVEDILSAQEDGLVTIVQPGIVVLCPVISKEGFEAPGNDQEPEDFDILEPGDSF